MAILIGPFQYFFTITHLTLIYNGVVLCYGVIKLFLYSAQTQAKQNKKIARLRPAAIAIDNFSVISDIYNIIFITLQKLHIIHLIAFIKITVNSLRLFHCINNVQFIAFDISHSSLCIYHTAFITLHSPHVGHQALHPILSQGIKLNIWVQFLDPVF